MTNFQFQQPSTSTPRLPPTSRRPKPKARQKTTLETLPLSLFVLPILSSLSMLLLTYIAPHDSKKQSQDYVLSTYTNSFASSSESLGIVNVLALVILLISLSLLIITRGTYFKTGSIQQIKLKQQALLGFTSILVLSLIYANLLGPYISLIITHYSPEIDATLKFCITSPTLPSSRITSQLLTGQNHTPTTASKCASADLVFAPVPHLDQSRIPGTAFGGVWRGVRVNQIPFIHGRFCDKSSLHSLLSSSNKGRGNSGSGSEGEGEFGFYPLSYLTYKDESYISKANFYANESYVWIGKSVDGDARFLSNLLKLDNDNGNVRGGSSGGGGGRSGSVSIGIDPYEALSRLTNRTEGQEKDVRNKALEVEDEIRDRLRYEFDFGNAPVPAEPVIVYGDEKTKRGKFKGVRRSVISESVLNNLPQNSRSELSAYEKSFTPHLSPPHKQSTPSPSEGVKSEGLHILQRYITNPHLINQTKYTVKVPVLITSMEPLRVYVHKGESLAMFACGVYDRFYNFSDVTKDSDSSDASGDRGGHNTKCPTGLKTKYTSIPSPNKALRISDASTWNSINNVIQKTLKAGLNEWKNDMKISKEALLHTGTRPSGLGGSTSSTSALKLANEYAKKVYKFKEGMVENEDRTVSQVDLSFLDSSQIVGGGYHLLGFEVLIDDGGRVWLVDVDSLDSFEMASVYDGDDGGERLMKDTLSLVGWTDDGSRSSSERSDDYQSLIYKVCESMKKFDSIGDSSLCIVRLNEYRLESERLQAMKSTNARSEVDIGSSSSRINEEGGYAMIHPTLEGCRKRSKSRNGARKGGKGEALDLMMCSLIMVDADLKEKEGREERGKKAMAAMK